MKSLSIHNVRFYKPESNAIYCMSLQKKTNKLALSRSDASVEIWNLNNTPFIETTIPSNVENFSIEGLAWFQNRLYSVGLHGLIVEYDLLRLSIANKAIVTGEAAYCLDIHEQNNQIAIGTEHGYLNLFQMTEDGVMFIKFLDKQEGRILCLKYDSTGAFIVSGGLDAIRIWDVSTGHALHKMTTGRSEVNKPTIVWCLALTKDFTIISGDSRGKLTFWDGQVGAQIESYQSHRADILSLCLTDDQTNLYCSGVDSTIMNFVKIQMKPGKEKWVRSGHKKIHDHDVRALVLNDNKLYSGGIDAHLAMSFTQSKSFALYPPVVQNPCVHICRNARYILLRYRKHIEIWSLGEIEDVTSNNRGSLKKEPKKLMVLQRLVKNHNGENEREGIYFASMSDDGKWIAYSTRLGLRVFQFIYENEETVRLLRVENTEDNAEVHLKGVFTPNNSQLITTLSGSGIGIYDIAEDNISISQKLDCKEFESTINFLVLSDDGKYLVAADYTGNIVVWRKKQTWNFYCKLPKYLCSPTSIALHPLTSDILIAYADNKIIEYSTKNKAFTSLAKKLQSSLPDGWSSRLYTIRNIFYCPTVNHIILHDDNSLMAIDSNEEESTSKGKKKKVVSSNGKEMVHRFRVMKKIKHLVHLGMLSDNEMVAVEVNPLTLLEQLPPALKLNKFGTK